jgi:hypothetical protein
MRIVSGKSIALAKWKIAQGEPQLTVIGATQYPGKFVMEEHSADIVQMAIQREQTPPRLV